MAGLKSIIRHKQKLYSITPLIALIFMCLLLQGHPTPANTDLRIYEVGTKFSLSARWLGLSAAGTMEIMGNAELSRDNTILLRSQVEELSGLVGFLIKFLRIYRESNTFDSYIDLGTLMTNRYEVYNLRKDGSKKITEYVKFDRKRGRIVSLEDNRIIASDIPPDTQDAFSLFLNFLSKINTEQLYVGTKFGSNLYARREITKIEVETTRLSHINGRAIYTVEIKELPSVFKYPASVSAKVSDIGDGFQYVTEGSCTIHIPVLPDITINAEVRRIKRAMR